MTFGSDQRKALRDRLENFDATSKKETKAPKQLENARQVIQDELDAAEHQLTTLGEDMQAI